MYDPLIAVRPMGVRRDKSVPPSGVSHYGLRRKPQAIGGRRGCMQNWHRSPYPFDMESGCLQVLSERSQQFMQYRRIRLYLVAINAIPNKRFVAAMPIRFFHAKNIFPRIDVIPCRADIPDKRSLLCVHVRELKERTASLNEGKRANGMI